jgi:ATP-dependent Lon protease
VKSEQVELPDETLRKLIASYTREAGVRRLEQTVGRVLRKIALQVAEGAAERFVVTPEQVSEMLGPEPFLPEQARRTVPAGVSTGLAWTETGGDVLYIEASLLPDGKGLTLTGQLGDVMKESAHIAQSYVWAHARQFGIDTEKFKGSGVHVHVPAGAIPKDGPSAGIAMTVALTSLYTGIPARNDTAMTGEVTLTGLALPIGGVKEKVLAARRAGIKRVVLPKANQKDLRDVPEEVRNEMTFVLVERVEEAIEELLPGIAAQVAKAA